MNQHTEPTAPQEQPSVSVRESARRRARAVTAPDGLLDRRRRELAVGLDDFAGAEPWVRGLAYLTAIAFAVLVLGTVGGILLDAAGAVIGAVHLPQDLPAGSDGLRAAITGPIHAYLIAHQAYPLTAATAYGAWKTVGLLAALLAFLTQGAVARAGWTAWSCATLAMVWQAAPGAGRPVAVGLTATAIALVSLFALRGLSFSLRSMVINRTEVQPQITIQTPEPKTARPRPAVPAPGSRFDQR
ncbi:hypothetical protein GCM10010441_45010 [Kitasatospora paracochleata]|uniref:Uncharacterized protein n=1 Tax=Kitasatospora paracochleata TaxID=58354 RepID=A0ABT1J9F4_9ACTN|nr:hypothetical protein [Kitasatospora paracochleata]MCP2314079.1 hypothetical protein [Kitasatospora paracochleata]